MKTFGLLGFPLQHSFSKRFFTKKFEREKKEAQYLNFEISSISKLHSILSTHSDLCGLNVTIPYKESVVPYLDELSKSAKLVGAVNVIQIKKDSKQKIKTIGHNSDLYGFYKSINPLINPTVHTKALVLGTGGASKAIIQGLLKLKIKPLLVSRSKKEGFITYEELTPSILKEHKVIVNCTPLGTYPKNNSSPNIPYKELTSNHLLYDLVYNPQVTLFIKKGLAQGAKTINGLKMLHLQAERSWEIWTNKINIE